MCVDFFHPYRVGGLFAAPAYWYVQVPDLADEPLAPLRSWYEWPVAAFPVGSGERKPRIKVRISIEHVDEPSAPQVLVRCVDLFHPYRVGAVFAAPAYRYVQVADRADEPCAPLRSWYE